MIESFIGSLLGGLTAIGITLLLVRRWLENGLEEVEDE